MSALHDPMIAWLLGHAEYQRTLADCQTDLAAMRARQAEADRYEAIAVRLAAVPGLLREARLPVFDHAGMAQMAATLGREAEGLPPVQDPLADLLSRPEPSRWSRIVDRVRETIARTSR